MKKLILLLFLVVFSNTFAQEEEPEVYARDINKNELSLDVLDVLAFGVLDISYEYLLANHSSVSVEVFNKLFNKNDGEEVDLSQAYSKEFSLTGKFKYFLDETQSAGGLYAMGFLSFSHGKHGRDVANPNTSPEEPDIIEVPIEFSDLALGVGGGYKLVSKQGFFADVGVGVGRNLFHRYSPDFALHPNVSVGFRF